MHLNLNPCFTSASIETDTNPKSQVFKDFIGNACLHFFLVFLDHSIIDGWFTVPVFQSEL